MEFGEPAKNVKSGSPVKQYSIFKGREHFNSGPKDTAFDISQWVLPLKGKMKCA